jgi:hypothetical protein
VSFAGVCPSETAKSEKLQKMRKEFAKTGEKP